MRHQSLAQIYRRDLQFEKFVNGEPKRDQRCARSDPRRQSALVGLCACVGYARAFESQPVGKRQSHRLIALVLISHSSIFYCCRVEKLLSQNIPNARSETTITFKPRAT